MEFLRDIAGMVTAVSLATFVAYYTNLEFYAVVCMGIQWLSALYAVPKQNERYFDLTGSITYAVVSLLVYSINGPVSWRESLLTILVWLWCIRLGSFLFLRILECKEDKRFKEIRVNALQFLGVWSIQGLWVLLTVLPVLLTLKHGSHSPQVSPLDIAGVSLWVIGYAMEVTADYQKTHFRRDKSKKDEFIQSGLWYYSRHPNYCGEIMMWVGVFCISVHTLPTTSLKCWAAVSPVFVAFLLMFVSGVPLLETQAEERWGKTRAWQEYKAQTSMLLPMPKHKTKAA
ncbi:unnamed protein product [Peronospora farinosa]|uniref:Steroid 5-alpha reductase C-terminal domain-containing protein n=1 Tax=Peronospora farinosa TaxID=134698 RepID=A0AAV0TJ54_9STRA|nr:unnamed protein product [Peronospora farinosa]CAI5722798.1 unnamed protein product [Peronospora farinosa]